MDAALNGGNLWVATALNGGRSLGEVEGYVDEKLCEGNSNPVGGCGAQMR